MNEFRHLQPAELPDGWTAAFFGDLASFKIGKTPARKNTAFWADGVYPWISISDFANYDTVTATREQISEAAHQQVFRGQLVPAGHYLMSFKLTVGRVARLGIDAYHNEAIISFLPNPCEVDPDFLAFYLSQVDYRNYRDTAVKGMTLNSGKLAKIEVALPPLDEQRKIAAVLSLVQRAINQQERLIALTTELKRALMHKLFTEGLHGEQQKETEIGSLPESWGVVTIGEVAQLGTGTTPSTTRADYYQGDIPFIKTTEIDNNRILRSQTHVSATARADYNLRLYPAGTVLMAMYGQGKTRGKVALLDVAATTSQNAAAIQPGPKVESEFLWAILISRYEDLRSSGAIGHLSHLNLGFVADFQICLPPIAEQQRIVGILNAIDARRDVVVKMQDAYESLFRTLLHHLMTGQMRVNDLDLSVLDGLLDRETQTAPEDSSQARSDVTAGDVSHCRHDGMQVPLVVGT